MELRGNSHLIQILQLIPAEENADTKEYEKTEQVDPHEKATAFFITAGIQVIFVIGCLFCGNTSRKNDDAAEEAKMQEGANQGYQRVENWSNKKMAIFD